MKLENKVVIVTGSTTGIGEAIARRCIAEGAQVLLHGRNVAAGIALVAELGESAAFHADDLADPSAAERIVSAAIGAFGHIDALCNNAALIAKGDLEATDAALFDLVMATNVRAPLLLIRAAMPHLEAARGCVLNIGSINCYSGEAKLLAYSLSKAALQTLSRNLADAYGRRGVRVNHFVVGWVLSDNEYQLKVSEGMPADWPAHPPIEYVPTGTMTQPDDVARAAVYWLSDESRPFSGGIIELEQYPMIGRSALKEGE